MPCFDEVGEPMEFMIHKCIINPMSSPTSMKQGMTIHSVAADSPINTINTINTSVSANFHIVGTVEL